MEDRVREAPAHPFPTTVVTHFTPSRPPGSLVSTVCLLSWGLSLILLREGPLPPVHAPLTPTPGLGVPVVANKRMLNESINESSPERPSPLTLHSQDQLASSELQMSRLFPFYIPSHLPSSNPLPTSSSWYSCSLISAEPSIILESLPSCTYVTKPH